MMKKKGWPSWETVLQEWKKFGVANLANRKFKIAEDHSEWPWFDRVDNRQVDFGSNPIRRTAFHLSVILPSKPADLLPAYQLLAFAREQSADHFIHEVLVDAFGEFGDDVHWWNGNAKNLLPPSDHTTAWDIRQSFSRPEAWRSIVNEAACTWRSIGSRWEIIMIPKHLDYRSADFAAYDAYCKQEAEKFERREYERLKAKYGPKS